MSLEESVLFIVSFFTWNFLFIPSNETLQCYSNVVSSTGTYENASTLHMHLSVCWPTVRLSVRPTVSFPFFYTLLLLLSLRCRLPFFFLFKIRQSTTSTGVLYSNYCARVMSLRDLTSLLDEKNKGLVFDVREKTCSSEYVYVVYRFFNKRRVVQE